MAKVLKKIVINGVDYNIPSGGGSVDDTAFSNSRDGETWKAPSQNAVYDKITSMDNNIINKITAPSGWNVWDVLKKTANGTEWGAASWGVLFTLPDTPIQGMLYYNTTNYKLYIYDWTYWRNVANWYIKGSFADSRDTTEILYSWTWGSIIHWRDNNWGEIEVKKSNWDYIIIKDRNIWASVAWTWSNSYWNYYSPTWASAPTWYHVPSKTELENLISYYKSITWLSDTSLNTFSQYMLMPFAGIKDPRNGSIVYQWSYFYYYSNTVYSGSSYYWIIWNNSQNYIGVNAYNSSTTNTPIRCFKNT